MFNNSHTIHIEMMHIHLCNNINNRLSIGGLTLYCISNNRNKIQSALITKSMNPSESVSTDVCIIRGFIIGKFSINSSQYYQNYILIQL